MDWEKFANRKGVKLYLEGKYDKALKFLREDDPYEIMLRDSVRSLRVCNPLLNLIITAISRGKLEFFEFLEIFSDP